MNIIKCLEKYEFISNYEVLDLKIFENGFYIKIVAYLKNKTTLFIREYIDTKERNYSYHWQTKDNKLIARWDNAPHHTQIITHPHHKRIRGQIRPSEAITCEEILREIENLIREAHEHS